MTDIADWTTHHIEGFAVHGNTPFSAPLISHIGGHLWMGGCIDGVRLDDDFDFVVSLYPWEKYALGPATARLEVEMYDEGAVPNERKVYDTARMVVAFLAKGKTLVHCQAGLNRSGLVSALALILQGMSAEAAMSILREQRSPAVLCNTTFSRWLVEQGAKEAA